MLYFHIPFGYLVFSLNFTCLSLFQIVSCFRVAWFGLRRAGCRDNLF